MKTQAKFMKFLEFPDELSVLSDCWTYLFLIVMFIFKIGDITLL